MINYGHNLLERTDMRMLIWMMGITRIEKIRNEEMRAEMASPRGEKDCRRCSNANMADGSGWTPTYIRIRIRIRNIYSVISDPGDLC